MNRVDRYIAFGSFLSGQISFGWAGAVARSDPGRWRQLIAAGLVGMGASLFFYASLIYHTIIARSEAK